VPAALGIQCPNTGNEGPASPTAFGVQGAAAPRGGRGDCVIAD
jgi:hypothetical protein